MNCEYLKGKRLVFLAVLVVVSLLLLGNPLMPVKNVEVLKTDLHSAELKHEINRDFLIYWGVLFLAFVTGVIELLPSIENKSANGTSRNRMLSLLYLGLVSGMLLSTSQCLRVVRENIELETSGALGGPLKQYLDDNPSLSHLLKLKEFPVALCGILMVGIAILFWLLYCSATINGSAKKHQRERASNPTVQCSGSPCGS